MKASNSMRSRFLYLALAFCVVLLAFLWLYSLFSKQSKSDELIPSQCTGTKIETSLLPNQYLFISDNGLGLLHLINSENKLLEEDKGTFSGKWIYRITFGSDYHIGNINDPSNFSDGSITHVVLIGDSNFSIDGKLYSFIESDRYKSFFETIEFRYNKYSAEYPTFTENDH